MASQKDISIARMSAGPARPAGPQPVRIPVGGVLLEGDLAIPPRARGLIAFAHGTGSSRLSPRNTFVSHVLRDAGFGTLLFDLLTVQEDTVHESRFNIPLLAERLSAATDWVKTRREAADLPVGYFGASTGAAAALIAASDARSGIHAVVSRGGRPDMASQVLPLVKCPTLLIVGGEDHLVIEMNRRAFDLLAGPKEIEIVPGATHLFEEPGALEEVARLATEWFKRYLALPEAEIGF